MASEEGKYSEQEEKEWEKKKRTRERVSTLMGQYLLKGYRMLNINCAECGNILLQTRDGTNYCVYCTEVVQQGVPNSTQHPSTSLSAISNTTLCSIKDGSSSEHKVPIVSAGQTRDTVKLTTTPAEHDTLTMCTDTKRTGPRTNPAIIQSATPKQSSDTSHLNYSDPSSPAKVVPKVQLVSHTEASLQCQMILISKLKWCASELEKTQSLEQATLLCKLITATGEALKTLQELHVPTSSILDHLRLDSA